jgi:endogenous inhibitor of DNA gyrase (YacG/DUF329 family)
MRNEKLIEVTCNECGKRVYLPHNVENWETVFTDKYTCPSCGKKNYMFRIVFRR